jgi:hypothetical protein
VIPLLVGGSRMPRPDELPESVRALSRRNALELSDLRWRHDVGRLVGTLGELLEGTADGAADATPRAAHPGSPAATPRVRRTWMGAIAAVLALGVVAAGLALAGVFSGEDRDGTPPAGDGTRPAPGATDTGRVTIDDAVAVVGEFEVNG